MKQQRIFLIAVLFLLFVSLSAALPTWVPLLSDPAPPGTPPTITVESSTINTTTIHINIHGFWVDEYTTQGLTFKTIYLPSEADAPTSQGIGNYGYLMNRGKSQLPVIRKLIGVVSDATTISVTSITELSPPVVLSNYRIYPFQEPSLIIGPTPEFYFDPAHYFSTFWYPYNPSFPPYPEMDTPIQWWHHCRVSQVNFYNFFANPGNQELRVIKESLVTLNHSGTLIPGLLVCNDFWKDMYDDGILNFPHIFPLIPYVSVFRSPKMVIYATSDFQLASSFTNFVNWKKRKGVPVTIRTIGTDVLNNSLAIKTDITNFYNSNSCYDIFVVLMGDTDKIVSHSSRFNASISSDFRYACVKGDDDYPDLFIGRVPASSTSELDVMLNKIITYEKNPPQDDWPKKALLCTHWENGTQQWDRRFTDHKKGIQNHSYTTWQPTFTTAYGSQSGVTNTTVINAINAHQGYVNYNGHGDWDCWHNWNLSGQNFAISQLDSLTNGNYTPIVFSTACYNGKITKDDCLSEEWLKKLNKGAVAALGSSDAYYTHPGHEWDRQLFIRVFGSSSGIAVAYLGSVNNLAHTATYSYWADLVKKGIVSSQYKDLPQQNAYQCMLLGDPELTVRTTTPKLFTSVTGTLTAGPPGFQNLTITVSDSGGVVKNACVVIESGGNILGTNYTDVNGKATFLIASGTTNIYATVSKQNYIVWEGYLVITGLSDWLLF